MSIEAITGINLIENSPVHFHPALQLHITFSTEEIFTFDEISAFLELFYYLIPGCISHRNSDGFEYLMKLKCQMCNHTNFYIRFSSDFQRYAVYIVHSCIHISWINNHAVSNHLNAYSLALPIQSSISGQSKSLKKLLKFIRSHSNISVPARIISFSKENGLSNSQKWRNGIKSSGSENMESIINSYPGWFSVFTNSTNTNSPISYHGEYVQQFTWVAPWASTVLSKTTYIELDGSFYALRPFVYAVPMAIIDNESIPLGISAAPSEREELFSNFYDSLLSSGVDMHSLLQIPVLSDEGAALKSFTESRKIRHFLCFRHLIQKFGSNSLVAMIVRRLLFESSIEAYEASLLQALSDLDQLISDDKVTAEQKKSFDLLFNDDFERQALWTRAKIGVSSCSNHVERFHRTLNEGVESSRLICSRLDIVLKTITTKMQSFNALGRRSAKTTEKQLMKIQSLKGITPSVDCLDKYCSMSEIYPKRFGLAWFPCVHTVGSRDVEYPNLPSFDFENRHYIETQRTSLIEWQFSTNESEDMKDIDPIEEEANGLTDEESGNSCLFILRLSEEAFILGYRQHSRRILPVYLMQRFILFCADNSKDPDDIISRSEFTLQIWKEAELSHK